MILFLRWDILRSKVSICWLLRMVTETKGTEPIFHLCNKLFGNTFDNTTVAVPSLWVRGAFQYPWGFVTSSTGTLIIPDVRFRGFAWSEGFLRGLFGCILCLLEWLGIAAFLVLGSFFNAIFTENKISRLSRDFLNLNTSSRWHWVTIRNPVLLPYMVMSRDRDSFFADILLWEHFNHMSWGVIRKHWLKTVRLKLSRALLEQSGRSTVKRFSTTGQVTWLHHPLLWSYLYLPPHLLDLCFAVSFVSVRVILL